MCGGGHPWRWKAEAKVCHYAGIADEHHELQRDRRHRHSRNAPAARKECIMRSEMLSDEAKDFSLALGGPIYQFFVRVGLVRPPFDRAALRIIIITLVAWTPLLLLASLGGRLTSGVKIPFLFDVETHCRFLITLPLLIGAEVTIHRRMRAMILQFVERQIITPSALPKFEGIIASALRLRNSPVIELGLLALVFVAASFWLKGVLAIQSDTWYAAVTTGKKVLAPAGYWYEYISLPIVQFIALRWYFRLFIWSRLLWQISRLDLRLVPSHPDSCCGLGFLGGNAFTLGPFLMAHSVLLSGFVANRILYEGTKLPDYRFEILAMALLLYLLALGPICVFAPRLLRQRIHGLYAYGPLASEYVIEFEKKWMEGQRPEGEALVGSGDIQSLADLTNSFAVVQHIKPFPFGKEAIIAVAVFMVLPILPLTLTMFSLQEIVTRLVQVLL
jgi:hypothetical protein